MKKITLLILLFWTLTVNALEPLLVMHIYDGLRVVLSQETECENKPKGYMKASAQRIDGLYIPGCWYFMKEYPNMIHIDWHNGDFSELPYDKFEQVELQ